MGTRFSNKARSQEQEKRLAHQFKGRLMPASGALPSLYLKGDIETGQFLIDAKITEKERYSISLKDWNKLNDQAWRRGKHPMLFIELAGGVELVVVAANSLRALGTL